MGEKTANAVDFCCFVWKIVIQYKQNSADEKIPSEKECGGQIKE